MPYADVDDARIFFTDARPGGSSGDTALLFVHGFSADSHDWSWQLPHFAAGHRVVAVDLRGHGASSAPDGGYTSARFAEDLVVVLDQVGVGDVVAIGHSMGGSVVSMLAVEHPDRVRAVVAVDPAYLLPDELAGGLEPVLAALDDEDVIGFVQSIVGGMDGPAADPALRTWHVRRVATLRPDVLRQALAAQVGGMALRSLSEPYLRRRTCPVLSFYADPTRRAAEEAVFADGRSRVVTWEGAGHWLHQERPAEFNALVTDWLATVRT